MSAGVEVPDTGTGWATVVGDLPDPATFATPRRWGTTVVAFLRAPMALAAVVGGTTLLSAYASGTPGVDALLAPRAGLLAATLVLGVVARGGRLGLIAVAVAAALLAAQAWSIVATFKPLLDDESSGGQAYPAVAGQVCLALVVVQSMVRGRRRRHPV